MSPWIMRSSLFLALFGLIISAGGDLCAQPQVTPSIGPASQWVNTLQNPERDKFSTNQWKGSISYALIDNQVNATTSEHYHRIVKDLINQDGVQSGTRLVFNFDPSYQQLTIHHVLVRRGSEVLNSLQQEKIKVIQQERDLERHVYDGTLSAVIFLEGVRVGDRLDYAHT